MKYDKPQKGNPYSLTIAQHILPKRSIERFTNSNGRVEVYIRKAGRGVQLHPENLLFCARRVWDQRAEHGYMKAIEDRFQCLVDQILSGTKVTLNKEGNQIVSSFFCLWDVRAHYRDNPIEDTKVKGIVGVEHEVTKDEEEALEKAGISVIRPDFSVPGRQITGAVIQIAVNRCRRTFRNETWGILRADVGEFIVPDRSRLLRIIPVSPTISLYASETDKHIGSTGVEWLNRKMLEGADAYYFAREFAPCPGL